MADQVEIEDGPAEVEILPEAGEGQPEAAPARAPEQAAEVDGVAQLRANLDRERQRADQASERARQLEAARQQDARRHEASTIDGQIAQIQAAKQASESAIERLLKDRAEALQQGRYQDEGKLTRQIAQQEAKIAAYDGGLYSLQQQRGQPQQRQDQRRPEPRQEQRQQPREPENPVDVFIQRNGLTGDTATFIRDNPDFIATPRSVRRMLDAHEDAEKAGHAAGSRAYFDFIKGELAPRQAAPQEQQPQRRPQPSAPPSRSGGNVGAPSRKLTITAAEARTAREIGVDLKDPRQAASYARELDRQRRGVA